MFYRLINFQGHYFWVDTQQSLPYKFPNMGRWHIHNTSSPSGSWPLTELLLSRREGSVSVTQFIETSRCKVTRKQEVIWALIISAKTTMQGLFGRNEATGFQEQPEYTSGP